MLKKLFPLLLILAACQSQKNTLTGLLPVLQLQSGQSDTVLVPDLFYAPAYKLHLRANPMLQTVYSQESRQLSLTPTDGKHGWTALRFTLNGKNYDMPVRIEQRIAVTLHYRPQSSKDVVRVIGSFNTWDRNSRAMQDEDGDKVLDKTFYLRPGRYEYKFYVNRKELIDPKNPRKVLNSFGQYNSLLTVQSATKTPPDIYNSGVKKVRENYTFQFKLSAPGNAVSTHPRVFAFLDNQQLDSNFYKIHHGQLDITLNKEKLKPTKMLRVAIQNETGGSRMQSIDLSATLKQNDRGKSFSWYDAIPYSIIIDRFKDGDPSNTKRIDNPDLPKKSNYYGGDLQGILDEIDAGYFSDLGVNVLWLSPVVQNPWQAYREYPAPHRFTSGYHGYWPIALDKVDRRFGDMDLLQKLVEHAHQRGLKVMLDFVSNHVHIKHPYYTKHRNWFGSVDLPDGRKNLRLWDEFRLTTWFETFLPSFDYPGSDAAVETMTDNAVWWLKETGVDGFRQDAVKHVPRKFWRRLTRKIKEQIEIPEDRHIYQIGESFGSDRLIQSYIGNGLLDAQFNFNLYDAAIYCFTNSKGSFSDLDAALNKSINIYGTHTLMGNIMDSHDKVRFLALADGDVGMTTEDPVEIGWKNPPKVDHPTSYAREQVYLAYMLSIPGIPFIYYGDEIGMTGAADPDNRRPMRFGDEVSPDGKKMKSAVKKLIAMRRDNSALRQGDFHTLLADKDVYVFVRGDMRQKVLVLLNKGPKLLTKELKLKGFEKTRHLIPLSLVSRYVFDGQILEVDLPAYSAQFILLKE